MQRVTDAMRLYVLWAPPAPGAATAGSRLAEALREHLDAVGMVRDGVGLRIPLRQRSLAWRPKVDPVTPRPIDLAASRSNVIIAVYDDIMAAREGWTRYLNDLEQGVAGRGGRDLLIMVLMTSDNAAPKAWSGIQAIRAPAPPKVYPDWPTWLRRVILDVLALCISHDAQPSTGPKKLCVFLSHAKADGENAALLLEGFRRLKPSEKVTSIDMYFDSSDTIAAAPFDQQFRRAIEQGVFLALVTDAYHMRRWCQWELLLAKELQRPILIWDRSEKGNPRSFPYLGNVPVIRAADSRSVAAPGNEEIEELLLALLLEALRMRVWKDYAGARIADENLKGRLGEVALFARPPELTDIAYHRRANGAPTIVYPDPPIGQDERELLRLADSSVRLLALSEVPSQ
jgi:hypothetical protein